MLKDNPYMGREERLVLLSTKRALGLSKEENALEGLLNSHAVDWQRFKGLMSYHETAPHAYAGLKKYAHLIPHEFMQLLKNTYTYNTYRNTHLLREFLCLSKAFERDGVPMAPIKGISFLNDIYADSSLRPMTDIDILTHEKDVQRSETILTRLGYKEEFLGLKEQYWKERQYHITFFKDKRAGFPVMLELHWALDYKRQRDVSLPLWSRLRESKVNGQRLRLLSPEDALFSLALHNRRFGKALCLKNVVDLVMLLKKYEAFDWDYVLSEARAKGTLTTLYFILSQAEIFLGFVPPALSRKGFGIPPWKRRAIRSFIEKNTFLTPRIEKNAKGLFLESHFLLYDGLWEPIDYILKIPQEQFAKFYGLKPYDRKTKFLYNYRLCYMPFRLVFRRKDDII
ncbi:MAG: nucleotidyltransferase family protein [Candidatus Omnitrophica bacterium]|nr:nucleotidyltransferase family protein [Candidatus Omnitrophota bacterium]